MTLFDHSNNIIFNKKGCCYTNTFDPFITCRMISQYDDSLVEFVNDTLNVYGSVFVDAEETYKLFYNLVPKLNYKRIGYIKKSKIVGGKDKSEISPEIYEKFANDNFMSIKELKNTLDMCEHMDN